jgi:hypothetical protein
MAPEAWGALVGTALTGISGLVLAASGYRRTRDTQLREDLEACYKESQSLRGRFHAALLHLGTVEDLLAMNKVKVPARPLSLDPEPTDAQPVTWRGRHAAT